MTSASAVSRALRDAGHLPVPPDREGLHVERSYRPGLVHVWSNLIAPAPANRQTGWAADTLVELGFTVEYGTAPNHLYVTRPAGAPSVAKSRQIRAGMLASHYRDAAAELERNPDREDLEQERDRAENELIEFLERHGMNGCEYDPRNAYLGEGS